MVKPATFVLLLAAALLHAETPDGRWQPLRFLIGKWTGTGGGQPGAGQGAFSFLPELNGQVLVRRNVNDVGGQRHEDLMIVYLEDQTPRAIYFDTEGHTIRYTVAFPASNAAVFESEASQPGPKYRLSYVLEGKNLNGRFEVGGKTYLTWTTVRE